MACRLKVHVQVRTHQSTTVNSWFSPSALWAPGIKLMQSDWAANAFVLWAMLQNPFLSQRFEMYHLISPFFFFTIWFIFSWWLSPTLYVLVYVQVDLKQLMLRVVLDHSFLSVESKAHLITASQLALSIPSLCLHHAGIRWAPLLTQKLYGFWGCKLWFSHQCFIHRPIPPLHQLPAGFLCLFIWFGWGRRSLHSLDWPRTGCVNQVGLELVILLLLTLRC